MAIYLAMNIPLKAMIDDLGLKRLADAAGLPWSTLWRWADKGRIPGRPADQEARADRIVKAARKLKPKAAKRKAGAA